MLDLFDMFQFHGL